MKLRRLSLLLLGLLSGRISVQTATATVASDPVGVLTYTVPAGLSGMSFPLIPGDVAVGLLAANSTGDVTFASASPISPLLTAGGAYYVEILSGSRAGDRFDVNTAATIATGGNKVTLILGGASHSTQSTLAYSLIGARAVVRAHVTLGQIAAQFSPVLTGSDTESAADGVSILGSGGFTRYYLRADGATWYQVGGSTDLRNLVISPDVSLVLDLRSGPRQLVQLGGVRVTPFRKNLVAGTQAFATGFPIDLTPFEAGAQVDAQSPAVRWTGSNNAAQADSLEIFDVTLNSFGRYYLRADGAGWRRLGRTDDLANTELLRTDVAMVLHRVNANADYRIAPPFAP